jgi:hypothetical protein
MKTFIPQKAVFYFFVLLVGLLFSTCKEAPTDAPVLISKITGKVTDANSNTPLAGAQITTNPTTVSVVTGPTGDYTLEGITHGTYAISAKKSGYLDKTVNVTLPEGKVISADIQMVEQSPELSVSTSLLDFDEAQTSLTFTIENKTKIGELTWQISFNQPWMSVSPSSGSTTSESDIITVTVRRDSLPYGGFGGVLSISSSRGSKEINVIVIKRNPFAPQLTVLPAELDFGTNGTARTLILKNTGTGTLDWDATSSEMWLSINKTSGNTVAGNPVDMTVSVNKAGLSVGNYEGVITVNSNGGNKSISVKMRIDVGLPPAPNLEILPSQLEYGTNFLTKTITIKNTGTGDLSWQATRSGNWMSLAQNSGSVPAGGSVDLNISVDRTGLNGGSYQGEINFTSNGGNVTVILNMTVVVVIPPAPKISVSPTQLEFGYSNAAQTVKVTNTGTGTLSWTAAPSANWISISQTAGSAVAGDSANVNITIIRAGLNGGKYQGDVVFSSNGGNQSVTVKMDVQGAILPAPELQVLSIVTHTSIGLGWTKAPATNFTAYKVFRSQSPGVTESSTLVATINNPETNNFTNTNLASGTTYYYRVFAYNISGEGTGSNEVSASTLRQFGSWSVIQDLESPLSVTSLNRSINCLQAINSSEAWYVSQYKVYHFVNNIWNDVYTVANKSLTTIWMGSDGRGFVGTSGSGLLKYDGISWTTDATFPGTYVYDIVGSEMNKLWVAGSNGIYFYNGSTWQFYNLNTSVLDLDYVSESEIWALGYGGKVYKYNGIGWTFVGRPYNSDYTTTISALNSNDVWIGYLDSSPNGLWHYDGFNFINNYKLGTGSTGYTSTNCIEMFSSEYGWRYDLNIAKLSVFDGNGWTNVNSPITSSIRCIRLTSAKTGWAVGSGGEILRYVE